MDIDFRTEIRSALMGTGRVLTDTTPDRADWSGPSTVTTLYDVSSGQDRRKFVDAIREIIEDPEEDNRVVADAIRTAMALNLVDLDLTIRSIQKTSEDPYIIRAAQTYVGYRDMALKTYECSLEP